MSSSEGSVVGRFAPSPTGPLHFGSLIAALGSFLDARVSGGRWLVRMEDVDEPRTVPGAADEILRTLDAFKLGWDGEVMYQSKRGSAYRAALDELTRQGHTYPCACSRAEIARIARRGESGYIYPGTCRGRKGRLDGPCVRVITRDASADFVDATQGEFSQSLEREVGDFILRRRDGLFAYQLAVVVDDAAQGVTQIVRGCDLLSSTPRQIYLQHLLGHPTPSYRHLPLAVTNDGDKLSKLTSAPPVDASCAAAELTRALRFLGQTPPDSLDRESPQSALEWAVKNWQPDAIPPVNTIPVQG